MQHRKAVITNRKRKAASRVRRGGALAHADNARSRRVAAGLGSTSSPPERFRVVASSLMVRTGPSVNTEPKGALSKDTIVEAVEKSPDGYWVRVESGSLAGWVSKKYLEPLTGSPFPWVSIAMNEIGIIELPGVAANPRIQEYLHSTTLPSPAANSDETAWCSAFVNWCVEQAGYAGTDSAWARSWLGWGRAVDVPQAGCIVVFRRNQDKGHVGFYMGETETEIRVLGGNQHNSVSVAYYSKSERLGYRVPD